MAAAPKPSPADPPQPTAADAPLEVVADAGREGTLSGDQTMVTQVGGASARAPLRVEIGAGPATGQETAATMPLPAAVPGVRPLVPDEDDLAWIGREPTLAPGARSQARFVTIEEQPLEPRLAPPAADERAPLHVPDGDIRDGTMTGIETMVPGRDDGAWAGREPTLAGRTATIAPRPGEATVSGMSTMVPGRDDGAWVGREATLAGAGAAPLPAPETATATATAFDAAEGTMTGVKTVVPGGEAWLGREATIGGDAAPAGAAAAVRAATAATPVAGAQAAPAGAWIGREATMPDPALVGTVVVAGAPGAGASTPTAREKAAEPGTGTRDRTRTRTGSGSNKTRTGTTFDDAWHLEGRSGPFTGEVWGDWAIGALIGEGGMGAVYKAKQISLGRRCALKVLASNLAGDAKLLKRFQMEARLTSMLSSPNIVAVYAAGDFEDRHFFVMEYVEGTDLYDIIKTRKEENRPLSPAEAADIVLQAARGLSEAGRYGIVHRDIKPPNLMVTRQGLVKIADFGIVKVMGESSLTMTGQAVGTPSYVSPEQGRGQADIDQRSDLYSLGVVFYELLCGKKPFHGSTPNALIYQHCYAEPELPKTVNPAVPDEYQAVALKCLQKKPENRYQSAEELIRDLEGIRAGNLAKEVLANFKLGTGAKEAQLENMSWAQRHLLKLVAVVAVALAGGGYGLYLYLDARAAERDRLRTARAQVTALEDRLSPLLDQPKPLPAAIDDDLRQYAGLTGHDGKKLASWQAKVARVRTLHGKLVPLDQPAPPKAMRQDGEALLKQYVELVGTSDPNGERWRGKLANLGAEEDVLRERLRAVDQVGRLTQALRDGQAPTLAQLRIMAGADDALVVRVAKRFDDYDAHKAKLLAALSVLDRDGIEVTEEQYRTLSGQLAELREMLGDSDKRLSTWAGRLTSSSEQVANLRKRLAVLDPIETPTQALLRDLDKDFAALRKLVPANDPQLVGWEAKRDGGNQAVASLRQQLLPTDQVACLQAGELVPVDELVRKYRALVGDGDADGRRWAGKLRDSRRQIDELLTAFRRFDRPEAFTTADLKDLAGVRDRLDAVGAISEAQRAAASKRLADEAERLKERQTRLKALDGANPLTPGLRQDLATYAVQVGEQDADVRRWTAKAAAIDALLDKLAVLDRPAAIPEDVTALFDRLAGLVGGDDPNIVRWRAKAQRLKKLLADLAPISRVAPLPAGAEAGLANLAKEVGESDPAYLRWNEKVTLVRAHQAALAGLPTACAFGADAHDRALGHLGALIDQVSAEDPGVAAAAARLAMLAGPGRPPWAAAAGRDQFGAWADLAIGDVRVRLRFVPAGSLLLGSPAGEHGRDADELAVPVTISRAFWLAEHEVTQRLWTAVMAGNPSRERGDELPVNRVTWDDAQRFATTLAATIGNGFAARLPSEAEWEYAARAGQAGPFAVDAALAAGGSGQLADSLGWHAGNAPGQSKAVKLRLPNPLGLYDLHGNVAEWCADRYGPYPTVASSDPLGRDGENRVVRGGSWGDPPKALRAANRTPVRPGVASAYIGLRIAADVAWPGTDGRPDAAALIAGLGRSRAVVREVTIGDPDGINVKVRVAVPTAPAPAAPAPVRPEPAAPADAVPAPRLPASTQPGTSATSAGPTPLAVGPVPTALPAAPAVQPAPPAASADGAIVVVRPDEPPAVEARAVDDPTPARPGQPWKARGVVTPQREGTPSAGDPRWQERGLPGAPPTANDQP